MTDDASSQMLIKAHILSVCMCDISFSMNTIANFDWHPGKLELYSQTYISSTYSPLWNSHNFSFHLMWPGFDIEKLCILMCVRLWVWVCVRISHTHSVKMTLPFIVCFNLSTHLSTLNCLYGWVVDPVKRGHLTKVIFYIVIALQDLLHISSNITLACT